MKSIDKVFALLFVGATGLVGAVSASENSAPPSAVISMVGSNAIANDLPYNPLVGKSFHAIPSASYVKIHLFPDEPLTDGLYAIDIESCGAPIKKAIAFI